MSTGLSLGFERVCGSHAERMLRKSCRYRRIQSRSMDKCIGRTSHSFGSQSNPWRSIRVRSDEDVDWARGIVSDLNIWHSERSVSDMSHARRTESEWNHSVDDVWLNNSPGARIEWNSVDRDPGETVPRTTIHWAIEWISKENQQA